MQEQSFLGSGQKYRIDKINRVWRRREDFGRASCKLHTKVGLRFSQVSRRKHFTTPNVVLRMKLSLLFAITDTPPVSASAFYKSFPPYPYNSDSGCKAESASLTNLCIVQRPRMGETTSRGAFNASARTSMMMTKRYETVHSALRPAWTLPS